MDDVTRLPSNRKRRTKNDPLLSGRRKATADDAAQIAEEAALAALGSGLRIAAALSTVAAKTASMALASLASGAATFAELVREEATRGSAAKAGSSSRSDRSLPRPRRRAGSRRKASTRGR